MRRRSTTRGVTAPSGIGIDALGNLYVTAASYNVTTINTTGTPLGPVTTTVTTPNVLMLANASVNFGIVDTSTTSDPVDINVFNIGNAPLRSLPRPRPSSPAPTRRTTRSSRMARTRATRPAPPPSRAAPPARWA